MRVILIFLLCLTVPLVSATSYRRPERPPTPEEQVELAHYDQEVIARNRRLEIRISADAEVQQMLEFVRHDEESDSFLQSRARLDLVQRDELAALIWANDEFDSLFGDPIEPITAETKAQQQQFHQLIARWKPTGSTVWGILDALTYVDTVEQKRLLAIALERPLYSPVTARARALALRYFELILLEPEPDLREALAVYRPNSSWMLNALLATGGIDFEGLLATSMLEPVCDLENPSAKSLKPAQCQSVLLQAPLLYLIMHSDEPMENFEEPARSAFVADQQLVEQVKAVNEKCASASPFAITMLRATSSTDWRSYLRTQSTQKCRVNTQ